MALGGLLGLPPDSPLVEDAVERYPAPDLALLVLRELRLSATDAIVVGDTTHDILMAWGAGIRSIAVTYGAMEEAALRPAEPTWIARSFAEVMRILAPLAILGGPWRSHRRTTRGCRRSSRSCVRQAAIEVVYGELQMTDAVSTTAWRRYSR